jgi:hypothetical protein
VSRSSDAYDGRCPQCGHVFTLVDLARMAQGDGWQPWVWARLPDGREALVRFGDFSPETMVAAPEAVEQPPSSAS